jgi:ADP-ribose pyrophosphatase YjhB (NUDIX family)
MGEQEPAPGHPGSALNGPRGAVGDVVWCRVRGLLLIRKAPHKFEGARWGLPGGKQEPGETSAAAAWRELREECGPSMHSGTLTHVGIVGVIDDIIVEANKHYLTMLHLFLAHPVPDCPEPINAEPENHDSVDWFAPGCLPRNCTRAFRQVVTVLRGQTGLAMLAEFPRGRLDWGPGI